MGCHFLLQGIFPIQGWNLGLLHFGQTDEPRGNPTIYWNYLLIHSFFLFPRGFPGGSDGKESACNAGDQVPSLGQKDPLEKGMATHSSILT